MNQENYVRMTGIVVPDSVRVNKGDYGTVTNFRLQVTKSYKNKMGEIKSSKATFLCVAFGNTGAAAQSVQAGDGVSIEGELKNEKNQSTGQWITKIHCTSFEGLQENKGIGPTEKETWGGGAPSNRGSQQQNQRQAAPRSNQSMGYQGGGSSNRDDIPF